MDIFGVDGIEFYCAFVCEVYIAEYQAISKQDIQGLLIVGEFDIEYFL